MATSDRHSYVQFYPSDWLGGTARMQPMHEWIYLQICLFNWDKGEAVPAKQLPMVLSALPSWKDDLQTLIDAGKLHTTQAGAVFCKRALVEATRAFALWDKKSRAGKKGAEKTNNSKSLVGTAASGDASHSSQNENENENESNSNELQSPYPLVGDLVFSVPPDAWKNFLDHRVTLKKPMSKHAQNLAIKKLEELWAEGHDPTAVINQSIVRGWLGLFAVKDDEDSNGTGSKNGFLAATLERERRGNS